MDFKKSETMEQNFCFLSDKLIDNSEKKSMKRNFHFSGKSGKFGYMNLQLCGRSRGRVGLGSHASKLGTFFLMPLTFRMPIYSIFLNGALEETFEVFVYAAKRLILPSAYLITVTF